MNEAREFTSPHTIRPGDYVYFYDEQYLYKTKTKYKVAYLCDPWKILVYVDLDGENKKDGVPICGWRGDYRSEKYGLPLNKRYWFVTAWKRAERGKKLEI